MTAKAVIVYWIRHTPVAHMNQYVGHTDVECTLPVVCDPSQAVLLAQGDVSWHASDLKRTRMTAGWLQKKLSVNHPIATHKALREQDFGAWEGKNYDDIYREHANLNWQDPASVKPEGGESFADVCARVQAWLVTFVGAQTVPQAAVFAHAGSIRAGLAYALDMDARQAIRLSVDPGSVSAAIYYKDNPVKGSILFVNRPFLVTETGKAP